jgi:hypothetical protein
MSHDNNPTLVPHAPQAPRRALLMGFAAAASPMAPALGTAMGGLPASPAAAPDPIFAVIAEHQARVRAYADAVDAQEIAESDEECEAAADAIDATSDAFEASIGAVLTTRRGAVVTATIIAFKPKPAAPDPLRDPRRNLLSAHHHSLLGINQRQEGMAHHLSFDAGTHEELIEALLRFAEIGREFKAALEAYREQLLKALATKCPAAAKRIREGKPPRRRSRRSTEA